MEKLIPLAKVDSRHREVWGIVTAEIEDKDGEICLYDETKQYYQALVDEMSKATDGKNIFPLREMHGLSAVGKGISIEFRDDAKEVYMGFKVIDDNAWRKCEESVYTGFSQGGRYVKRDKAIDGKTYYVAAPTECSLVDNPALGVAHFEYVKADGTTEMRKAGSNVNWNPTTDSAARAKSALKQIADITREINQQMTGDVEDATDLLASAKQARDYLDELINRYSKKSSVARMRKWVEDYNNPFRCLSDDYRPTVDYSGLRGPDDCGF